MTLKIALFHELPIIFLFACRLCFEFSTRRHVRNSRRSVDECCRWNSQDGNVVTKEFQIFLLGEWLYPNHHMQPTLYSKMHSEVRRSVRIQFNTLIQIVSQNPVRFITAKTISENLRKLPNLMKKLWKSFRESFYLESSANVTVKTFEVFQDIR